MTWRPFRVCVLDMNAGANARGVGDVRSIVDRFFEHVTRTHPGFAGEHQVVDVRATARPDLPDSDLYIATGGPGDPHEIDTAPWGRAVKALLERLASSDADDAPSLFGICYSLEVVVHGLGLGVFERCSRPVLGVFPVTVESTGLRDHPLLSGLAPTFQAVEIREWGLASFSAFGCLARSVHPSADGAVLAIAVGKHIEGTQFHPECPPAAVATWLEGSSVRETIARAHGIDEHARMVRACREADGLPRTHAQILPGWLARKLDELSRARGWEWGRASASTGQ